MLEFENVSILVLVYLLFYCFWLRFSIPFKITFLLGLFGYYDDDCDQDSKTILGIKFNFSYQSCG